jgi:hypothetical protein
MFDPKQLREVGLDPARLYSVVLPRPPSFPVGNAKIRNIPKRFASKTVVVEREHSEQAMEQREEVADALSPIYDQLSLHRKGGFSNSSPVPEGQHLGFFVWVCPLARIPSS